MFSTKPDASLDSPTLTVGGEQRRFELVGVARWGVIYVDTEREDRVVRVLETHESTLHSRQAASARFNQAYEATATLRGGWQDAIGGEPVYVLEYALPKGSRPLFDVLERGSVQERLRSLAAICEMAERWWSSVGVPLLPMLAELWIDGSGQPCLLPFPANKPVGLAGLLSCPERTLGIAPEYFQIPLSNGYEHWAKELDLFALGALITLALTGAPSFAHPEAALHRAACGVALEGAELRSTLPLWTGRLRLYESVTQAIAPWLVAHTNPTARRGSLAPNIAAERLRSCAARADAVGFVKSLQKQGTLDAYGAVLEILRDEDNAQLLLLAGGLAAKMQRPLEAVDYFERAAAMEPELVEPHQSLFELLCVPCGQGNPAVVELYENRLDMATNLDGVLEHAFDWLDERHHLNTIAREVNLAQHYLWRANTLSTFYGTAAHFIRPRLFRHGNTLRPEKFELCAEFAAALLGMGRAQDANTQLRITLALLERMTGRADIDQSAIRRTRRRLNDIAEAIQQGGGP